MGKGTADPDKTSLDGASPTQSAIALQSFAAPTTLPSVLARSVAFTCVLVASVCGGLIGSSVVDLQCTQQCTLGQLSGAVVGSAFCAIGVALIAVLVLRSKGEWDEWSRMGGKL